MKETTEFRINYDFANLLFEDNEGVDLGQISKSIKVVQLSKDDPRYSQIPIIAKQVKDKYNKGFFFGWKIKRKYSKKELDTAILFQIKIKTKFEPTGEECGTTYDEKFICDICGVGRKQIGLLKLKKNTIPNKDIVSTIGGEVLVSEKFVKIFRERKLNGVEFAPVVFEKDKSNYFQLIVFSKLELTNKTIAGINPFDFSESCEIVDYNVSKKEIYKCPRGHTIGLNLLSEAYVEKNQLIQNCDFFVSKQRIGVSRGLLKPEPLYFCSIALKKMIDEEKLSGFDFEIANVE